VTPHDSAATQPSEQKGGRRYRLISSDSHVNEPPGVWIDRVPAALRDRAPRMEHFPEGDAWIIDRCSGKSPS